MDEFFPAVLEKGHGEIEVRFRHFKTGEARWMAYKVLTLTDAAGQPVALATVSQDVTERRMTGGRPAEAWPRTCPKPTAARTSSWRCWPTNCATPWPRSATPCKSCGCAAATATRFRRQPEVLERQLGQMVRLVDDLLDMSRITHGKLELRKEQVPSWRPS